VLLVFSVAMYGNFASQPGADPQGSRQPSPFGSAFYGAGSGLIKTGLGAYSEKFFGSNSELQNNVCYIIHRQILFLV
jgi:protein transport protein YIF1